MGNIKASFAALLTRLRGDGQGIAQVLAPLGFMGFEMLMGDEHMIDDRRHPLPRRGRAWGTPDRWSPSTPAVVVRALFGIFQDGVGLVEAAQASLSLSIVRVQIWMEACGQAMVSLLDFLRTRLSSDAENLIIIRFPQG
jgi:hypothetical protein